MPKHAKPSKASSLPMGRPPKTDAERKEDIIRVRVTAKQKALMTATATRLGYDVSTWLRVLGLREAQREAQRETPQDVEPGSY